MKVFVLTDFPSPYQVELFNEIEAQGQCSLQVAYLRNRDRSRQWQASEIRHAAITLDKNSAEMLHARAAAREAELVVFNYYRHAEAERLIDERAIMGAPWCFWGERPGFHQPRWAGRLLRKFKLSQLHHSSAPIWGIGKFAVDGYRKEFGNRRDYYNLPYFSDLKRFITTSSDERDGRTFLFSGSLSSRKGADLVAAAFVQLAREVPNIRLKILGDGELRNSLTEMLSSVREQVEFVGFRDWYELPGVYASADALCVPSRYDGWGLVVPEGLASGLPVIATDSMGAGLEFVETRRNGWLIRARAKGDLLNAMREAASLSKSELHEMRQYARQSVAEHTLRNGAHRFVRCAHQTVSSWSHAAVQRRNERHKEDLRTV